MIWMWTWTGNMVWIWWKNLRPVTSVTWERNCRQSVQWVTLNNSLASVLNRCLETEWRYCTQTSKVKTIIYIVIIFNSYSLKTKRIIWNTHQCFWGFWWWPIGSCLNKLFVSNWFVWREIECQRFQRIH